MPDVRHLIVVLGDQLSPSSPVLREADPERDVVLMAEVEAEIRRYPNHKQRVVLFLAAMRHFSQDLRKRGFTVDYQHLDDPHPEPSLPDTVAAGITRHQPERVVLVKPGRYDLERALIDVAKAANISLDIYEDDHFLCSVADFRTWASARKTLVLEHFYRMMRKQYGYLMEGNDPVGGAWNFDKENRQAFGKDGPDQEPSGMTFEPDTVTQAVIATVEERFPDLYGSLDTFAWPVTAEQARVAVHDFIQHRLPQFGAYQDAMWMDRPFLYHSRIGAALNLRLLDPRWVIEQAEAAYRDGHAPLNAVEGFIRQMLGWREFIRGIYWLHMPDYLEGNALNASEPLPDFFWTGKTKMTCIRQVVEQLLRYGYAHHIQRLMVTGLFSLLYGVQPVEIHEWYMALYIDSVEWVTLPNTVGMSQYADGGIVGTKPYIASGKYINRMSNYCGACRYNPNEVVGNTACPFTTLYWEFLMRHEDTFASNRRMVFQVRNLQRKSASEREAIAEHAKKVRRRIREGTI